MKVFEQEQKIREEAREEAREEERVNTERERQRAENAETRAEKAETRLQLASKIIGAKRHHPEWTDQQLAEACGCTMEELDSF